MESDWRYNVALFGLSYEYWEYIARFVTSPLLPYNYLGKLKGDNNVYFLDVRFDDLFGIAGGFLPDPPNRHFPWGYDVAPD